MHTTFNFYTLRSQNAIGSKEFIQGIQTKQMINGLVVNFEYFFTEKPMIVKEFN